MAASGQGGGGGGGPRGGKEAKLVGAVEKEMSVIWEK
jgi:hypothetical protein